MTLAARLLLPLPLLAAVTARADEAPPSFRHDVLPVLTRFGCNQGACHGKLAGQNGFRLSLRGYAPEWDHGWIVREFDGRRINRSTPAESLLLKKASGQVPHGGGRLLPSESAGYKVLHDWIAAGAPGLVADEPPVERIEISPGDQTLTIGQTAQLAVKARYADGRERDVTWLAKFFSNDEATASVTAEGVVASLRPGETAIRIHFDGLVAVVAITTPFDQSVDQQLYAERKNVIDEHVLAKLAALKIAPSQACDDATFLRRAFLDAIGTLPTEAEVMQFLADTSSDKRAKLIDELLERPEWVDYWTLQLCDVLQNRKERDHDVRGTKGVRSFQAWVREQLTRNRPWNEVVRDVLTAAGDASTQPQIGYYIVTVGEHRRGEESEAAAAAAQAFLGVRIGCAKCHNHPLEKYTQDDYYHLAAFFGRVGFDRKEWKDGATLLMVASEDDQHRLRQIAEHEKKLAELQAMLAGKSGDEAAGIQKQIDERQKQRDDERKRLEESRLRPVTVHQPRTGKQLAPQGLDRVPAAIEPGSDPRAALARWITDPANQQFSGAMVNRLWKHFFSVGLVEPVDDLRASNPPSNRPLWDALNKEFVASGYNLKHVMRLVMNSRTYQLASTTLPANAADRRFYSHYYARRLPAEVLLDALSQASGVPDEFPGYPVGLRAVQLPDPAVDSYFLRLFGRSSRVTACACERMGDVTLPQLLHLQCGDGLLAKLNSSDSTLKAWLAAEADDKALARKIFFATLSREPAEAEMESILAAIAGNENREEAMRDLFWAVVKARSLDSTTKYERNAYQPEA
jgi:hypothetical protein